MRGEGGSGGPEGPADVAVPRIFISYRREETAYAAGWLFDRLTDRFGGQVFKDVDSIELGDDFVEVITSAVGSCDVLLALIGDEWSTITDEDGGRRLDDPDDFVRVEVEAALARNVRVIPILVGRERPPRAEELPPSLAKLVRRQALELSPSRFETDTDRLLEVLEKTLAELGKPQDDAAPAEIPPERSEVVERHERRTPDEKSSHDGENGGVPTPQPTEPEPRTSKRRTRTIIVAAVGAIAAATVAIILLTSGGDGTSDGGGGTTVTVGEMPVGIASGGGHVWTANRGGSVSMVDPVTHESTEFPLENIRPEGVAVGDTRSVWVTDHSGHTVTRLSSADGSMQGTRIPVGAGPADLAVGGDSVWVANQHDESISRIDLENPEHVTPIPTNQSEPYGVAARFGDVWVTNRASRSVTKIDVTDGHVIDASIHVGKLPKGIAVSRKAVWVANAGSGTVTRIARATSKPSTITVGGEPRGVVATPGSIWVTDGTRGTVIQLDEKGTQIGTIDVGTGPDGITVEPQTGTVWVANGEDGTVTEITP